MVFSVDDMEKMTALIDLDLDLLSDERKQGSSPPPALVRRVEPCRLWSWFHYVVSIYWPESSLICSNRVLVSYSYSTFTKGESEDYKGRAQLMTGLCSTKHQPFLCQALCYYTPYIFALANLSRQNVIPSILHTRSHFTLLLISKQILLNHSPANGMVEVLVVFKSFDGQIAITLIQQSKKRSNKLHASY